MLHLNHNIDSFIGFDDKMYHCTSVQSHDVCAHEPSLLSVPLKLTECGANVLHAMNNSFWVSE